MAQSDKKIKRGRAVSAKPSAEKNRPLSGNSRNINKIEFIENMYGGILANKRMSERNCFKISGNGDEFHLCKTGYTKIFKEKQQLLQENMQLKTEINKLLEKLSLQKGKIEDMRLKLNEETKNIGVQFQKQAYWSGSNVNMVRGLKVQYWKMKEKYQQKCCQYDKLTQQLKLSKPKEDAKYIAALQTENERLKKRLSQSYEEVKQLQHNTITTLVEQQLQVHKKLKLQLQEQNQRLNEYLSQIKSKLKIVQNSVEEKDKKIKFLDKLLIEKGNLEHGALRKIKQMEKEKLDMINELNQLKKQKDNLCYFFDSQVKKLKGSNDKIFNTEINIFNNQLAEKSDRINKLQHQIAYLTTLYSNWKPLDDINCNMFLLGSKQQSQKDIVLEYSMNSTVIKYNASRHNSKIPSQQQQQEECQTRSIIANSRKGSLDQGYRNASDIMTKSINVGKVPQKKREQYTADKRNNAQATRSKKVDFKDVSDLFQTLKYRFIGFGISIEQIRKYFDYAQKNELTQQDKSWTRQYITMCQVEAILKNQIFGLKDDDARLVSRYLIQPNDCEQVYCDPNNQNIRQIVKSIITNQVGQYQLPKNKAEIVTRGNELISKLETNLQAALHSTAPRGIISKRKLLEIFKGMGIQLSPQQQDYFIGKIIIKSDNLLNLKYKVLFER